MASITEVKASARNSLNDAPKFIVITDNGEGSQVTYWGYSIAEALGMMTIMGDSLLARLRSDSNEAAAVNARPSLHEVRDDGE